MAKLILNDVENLNNPTAALTTINDNWDRIENAVEAALSREGIAPNFMDADLDMNVHRIYNLPKPLTSTEVVRLKDLQDFAGGGGGGGDSGPNLPYFPTKALAELEDLTDFTMIQVGGWSTEGDGGDAFWIRRSSEPVSGLSFQDSVDNWFELVLSDGVLNLAKIGYKADGFEDGSSGTDNTAIIQQAIDSTAGILVFPTGIGCFDSQLVVRAGQIWYGQGAMDFTNNVSASLPDIGGTALLYRGTVHSTGQLTTATSAITNRENEIFTSSFIRDIAFHTTEDNTVNWIMDLSHARGTFWAKVNWGHRGFITAFQNTQGGCLRIRRDLDNTKAWVHHFTEGEFRSQISRVDGELGDVSNYEGYAFAVHMTGGNDMYFLKTKFNNTTLFSEHNGGLHVIGCNFENTDWGNEAVSFPYPAFQTPSTGRANWVVKKAGEMRALTCWFVGCGMSQGTYAGIIDATNNSETERCDVLITMDDCFIRRARLGEILLKQSPGLGGNGLFLGNNMYTTLRPLDEEGVEGGDDGTGTIAHPRIIVEGGPWPGLRIQGGAANYPLCWDQLTDAKVEWNPTYNDSSTISFKGLPAERVGTAVDAILLNTNYLTGTPRAIAQSSTTSAEFYGGHYCCVRNPATTLGGYWARFRFSTPLVAADSRGFVGLQGSPIVAGSTVSMDAVLEDLEGADPADWEPANLTQAVGLAFNTGESNWSLIMADNAGVQMTEDLGADYPVNTEAVYELIIWTGAGTRQWVRIIRLDDKTVVPHHKTYSTGNGPGGTQRLAPHFWIGNADSNPVQMAMLGLQIKPQPDTGYGNPFAGLS